MVIQLLKEIVLVKHSSDHGILALGLIFLGIRIKYIYFLRFHFHRVLIKAIKRSYSAEILESLKFSISL